MIKEMEFTDAVRFAKACQCYFRPEFSDNWISSSDFTWVSRYGVPVKDIYDSIRYVNLDPSITTAKRWEFLISDELYGKIQKRIQEMNKEKVETVSKASTEQFPSPVRLCDLKSKDMFRLADDVHSGWYCVLGNDWDGRISVSNFEENPDSNYYQFRQNILVYKTDKNGEIVDATSEV